MSTYNISVQLFSRESEQTETTEKNSVGYSRILFLRSFLSTICTRYMLIRLYTNDKEENGDATYPSVL